MATGKMAPAEDVCQEAYARAFQRWRQVGAMDRPDLWVTRVAINLARDHARRPRPLALHDQVVAGAPSPVVESLWLEWGLAQLSPMQRAAIVLHHIEGRDLVAIAADLGRSRETIKSHLAEGRRRLARLLGPESRQ